MHIPTRLLRPGALALLFAAVALPAAGQDTKPPPETVWTKTKAVNCEVLAVHHCRSGACTPAAKLPSFKIDLVQQTMCIISEGGCKNALKVGQVGLDGSGTRLIVHGLGVAFVVGIDADGTMNAADVVRGRVVAIHGRCTAG